MRAKRGFAGGWQVCERRHVTGTLDEETARAAGLELTEPDPLVRKRRQIANCGNRDRCRCKANLLFASQTTGGRSR